MPPLISVRAKKVLSQNPGTIYLPTLGAVRPERIESFTSYGCYCWVKFRSKETPTLLSWALPRFAEQLPGWTIIKVPLPTGKGGPRKRLIPSHQ